MCGVQEYQKIGKEHTEKGKYVASEVEDQWRVDPAVSTGLDVMV